MLMIQHGIRSGINTIWYRYGIANNKYMGETYDSNKPSSFITYLDANNLYGWAMSKPLTTCGFAWMTDEELVKFGARNLSYRKDDRAMRPIYGCPGKFWESWLEICNGRLFRSILRTRVQNWKFVAFFTRSWDNTPKIWQSLNTPTLTFLPKNCHGWYVMNDDGLLLS